MAQAQADLAADPHCVKAWRLWSKVATRFTFDGHLLGTVFERLTQDYSPEEFEDMLGRMSVLYDTFCPPETKTPDA